MTGTCTDVEQLAPSARLQFSTTVEVRVVVFSWLVGSRLGIFLENRSKDFLDFWHEDSGR